MAAAQVAKKLKDKRQKRTIEGTFIKVHWEISNLLVIIQTNTVHSHCLLSMLTIQRTLSSPKIGPMLATSITYICLMWCIQYLKCRYPKVIWRLQRVEVCTIQKAPIQASLSSRVEVSTIEKAPTNVTIQKAPTHVSLSRFGNWDLNKSD